MKSIEINQEDRALSPARQFTVSNASALDMEIILQNIKLFKRQSMNIRQMNNVEMFVIKDEQNIAGWIGVSNGHFFKYSEYFSLFVYPEYRGFGLGLFLELIVVENAITYGSSLLHFRVDSAVTNRLTQSRLESGFISYFTPTDEIKELCTKCELFQNECQSQTYMKIDTLSRKKQLQEQLKKYESKIIILNQLLNTKFKC